MADRRPAFALPAWVVHELRAALPVGWEMAASAEPADGTGDGTARVSSRLLALARDAEVYLGYGLAAELVRECPRLRWAHSGAAGVAGSITPELKASDVVFTNSAGVHAPPMAETVVGMLLHFFRGLDFAARNQARRRWSKLDFLRKDTPVRELGSATVGIVGFGGVGRSLARLLEAFGSRVLGLKRNPDPMGPASFGPDEFHGLLSRSDAVVVAIPETPATSGMFDQSAFAAMRSGAVLVNVSRGGVVDEEAMVAALRSGRLRGAGLDVFRVEPLPVASPLWAMENVLVTPHVSAISRGFWRRELDLVLHNLACHVAGAPPSSWRNVVDLEQGY